MILRRFVEHVTTQNWFAVGLDVLVVIVGIFLGMQVTDWNEARKSRLDERQTLEAVRAELVAAADRQASRLERVVSGNDILGEAIHRVQDFEAGAVLAQQHCDALWRSHIINTTQMEHVGALQDLADSGRIYSLGNESLRQALLEFNRIAEWRQRAIEVIQSDIANVVDNYAAAFARSLTREEEHEVNCQQDELFANRELRNKLISNFGRRMGLQGIIGDHLEKLQELDDLIGEYLSVR